jgi:DNA-binding XRE family transcriptional regulator
MIRRCGDTPLKTRTPSGGMHLWYRHAGEECTNLRDEGLNVDVRGAGGIIIVPPSSRQGGLHAGCAYEFIEGSWDDLTRLPAARPGSLPMAKAQSAGPIPLRAVGKGRRNRTLFSRLLHQARHCDDIDALRDVADGINSTNFEAPLPAAEIEKTVRSAWGYEERGENWAGKEPRVTLTRSQHQCLRTHRHGVDAWFLLAELRFVHWDRDEFAVVPEAMAKAGVVSGWGHQRYRNALRALVDTGILTITHQGGCRIGDARQYAFSSCLAKATGTGGNTTEHLSPSLGVGPVQAWSKGRAPVRSPRRTLAAARPHGGGVQLDLIELLGGPPASRRIDDPVLFGSAAREARIARNLTQEKVTALAGISRSALGNIETGTFPAGLGTQVRLAAALGLPLAS